MCIFVGCYVTFACLICLISHQGKNVISSSIYPFFTVNTSKILSLMLLIQQVSIEYINTACTSFTVHDKTL